jgi:hypothetical protein
MERIKFYFARFFAFASMGLFVAGCQSNNDTSGTSRISVRMMDAPADYDEVNVEVLDVLIKDNSDTGDQGWVSICSASWTDKVYNLLT